MKKLKQDMIDNFMWDLAEPMEKKNNLLLNVGLEIINTSMIHWIENNMKLKPGESGVFTYKKEHHFIVKRIDDKYFIK